MKNKNQDRIEKLKGLATTNEDDQHKPHIASKNIDHVIKLNEELTAENLRLAKRCDVLSECAFEVIDKLEKQDKDLQAIKSKWWYKLMTWGW